MSGVFDFTEHSHRRFNPLTNSWVLCSPHRAKRPWLGQQEKLVEDERPEYVPSCYLCPSNSRVGGDVKNPAYKEAYVFSNDFPAVRVSQPAYSEADANSGEASGLAKELLKAEGVRGQCKVVCFSPKHNLSMAQMTVEAITAVVNTWAREYDELSAVNYINYVQIFENKGAVMGCSNPHPHGQIWALEDIPEEPAKELKAMAAYRQRRGCCLLCDYVKLELTDRSRLVCENDSFVCIVPFWAVWPYETLVVSKRHKTTLSELTSEERTHLANLMKRITCRYDNVFRTSFPYSMGIHGAPTDGKNHQDDSHLHIHFYPPLLRSASVKKFLVGFEMLGEPQRDLTSEQAAARLRECSEVHYKDATS
ncbi:galactose-1-phosphate uridylyltransferase [Phlyctochytrium arcticum]|nr:galactose-1-phosphate uridylyltransferase [Phlyctochytrium arcticum]